MTTEDEAPAIFSLWKHKRTGHIILVDANRTTAAGIRQVRTKHDGKARWMDLDKLTDAYEMEPEP